MLVELFFFLSNAKFSFAIFAKFVDCWRAFFNFALFRYELTFAKFIILGIDSMFVKVFFYDCNENSCYFNLRFLRHLRTFQGPSSSFFFLSLEFGYVCCSCYSCHICYSVFLDSGFL